jgi:hypothetical protein
MSPATALSGLKAGVANVDGVTEVGRRGGGFRGHGFKRGGFGFRHGGFKSRGFGFRHGGFKSRAFRGHKFRGHRFHGHKFHRHRHKLRFATPFLYGYPYYYYSYGYGDCHWLRIRAIRTGSPYWWWRYEECLNYW